MKKIQFQNAQQTAPATVTIDGKSHNVTPAVITGGVLPNADNLNQLQTNIEDCFNGNEIIEKLVVEDIKCKNFLYFPKSYSGTQKGLTLTGENGIFKTSGTLELATSFIIDIPEIVLQPGTYTLSNNSENIYPYLYLYNGVIQIAGMNSSSDGVLTFDIAEPTTINKIHMYFNTNDSLIIKPQLEKGSQATNPVSFKKYGYNSQESMGKIVVDDIESKNSFNKFGNYISQNAYLEIINNGIKITSTDAWAQVNYDVVLKPNTQYTLSFNIKSSSAGISQFISVYDGDTPLGYIEFTSTTDYQNKKIIFTTTSNTNCKLRFSPNNTSNSNTGFYSEYQYPQIEKGSTSTPYSDYKGIGYTSGKNENGSWVKYDDGRLEIYGNTKILENQENVLVNFPVAFANTNYSCCVTASYNYYNNIICTVANRETASIKIFAVKIDGTIIGHNQDVDYQIKGYWK